MLKITERKEVPVVVNRYEERNGQDIYVQKHHTEQVLRVEDEDGNHRYVSGHMLGPGLRPTAISKKFNDFGGESHREMYYAFQIGIRHGYFYTGSREVYEGFPDEHPDFSHYVKVEEG